jgi:hypothetical protein
MADSDFSLDPPDAPAALAQPASQDNTPALPPPFQLDAPPDEDTTDYGAMPMGDVLKQGAGNLPGSAWNAVKALPEAAYNYDQTGRALKQIGIGAASKVRGALPSWAPGAQADQPNKEADEAVFNKVAEPFTSVAGFKKSLATDPFTLLSIASIPFSGGAGLLGDASLVGKGLGIAAKALDPAQAALSTAGALGKGAFAAAKGSVSAAAGVPSAALGTAYKAGAASGAGAADVKKAFNDFATGVGDPVDFSGAVRKAVVGLKQDSIADWAAKKGDLTGATTAPVPLDAVSQAWDNAHARLSPQDLALDPAAHNALENAGSKLNARASLPAGDPEGSVLGWDKAKQELHEQAMSHPLGSGARNSLFELHNGVGNAIRQASPEYGQLMDHYQQLQDNMQNITKSLGTGDKVAANRELANFLRAQKTPEGQQLIQQLADKDPRIPYMTAGAALHASIATGVPGWLESGSVPFHIYNIWQALASGSARNVAASIALPAIQGTVQSPYVLGKAAYTAGQVAGSPVGAAARMGAQGIRQGEKVLGPAANQLESDPVQQALPQRAAGGAVGGHQHLVDRLLSAVERAKREEKEHTKPILHMPDEAVASALNKAQEAI